MTDAIQASSDVEQNSNYKLLLQQQQLFLQYQQNEVTPLFD